MVQFTKVLDLPHGRHVETILELAHLDLLDGDPATRRELPAWRRGVTFRVNRGITKRNEPR
jgi:hypothetical protein